MESELWTNRTASRSRARALESDCLGSNLALLWQIFTILTQPNYMDESHCAALSLCRVIFKISFIEVSFRVNKIHAFHAYAP